MAAKNSPKKLTDAERARAFYKEGIMYLSKRRFNDALEIFEQALRLDNRDPAIYVQMGTAALYLDYLDEAQRFFERAVQLDRDNVHALNGLAYLALRHDDAAEATNYICDVLKVRPRDHHAKKAFADLNTAESIEAYIARIHPGDFVDLPSRLHAFSESTWNKPMRYLAWVVILSGVLVIIIHNWDILAQRRVLDINIRSGGEDQRDYHYPSDVPLTTDLGRNLQRALSRNYDTSEYYLGEMEASRYVTRIQQLINSREYNESRYLYNRVKAGSVDQITMELVEKIKDFIQFPDPDSLQFNPLAADIAREPFLYERVAVKWFARTVYKTNDVFLQIAPARYHTGEGRDVRVFVVGDQFPDMVRGKQIEVFGEVLGVEPGAGDEADIIFLGAHRIREMQ